MTAALLVPAAVRAAADPHPLKSELEVADDLQGNREYTTRPKSELFVTQMLEEGLEAIDLSPEFLSICVERERAALRREASGTKDRPAGANALRDWALKLMWDIARHLPEPEMRWFEAARIFDSYDAVTGLTEKALNIPAKDDMPLEPSSEMKLEVTLVAVSCVRLVGKSYSALLGRWLSTVSSKLLPLPPDVLTKKLHEQEHLILNALDWRVDAPMASWISLYTQRCAALYQDKLRSSLDWTRQLAISCLAWPFLVARPASDAPPPQRLAACFFAIALAGAGVLPLESLKPRGIPSEVWAERFELLKVFSPKDAKQDFAKSLVGLIEISLEVVTGLVIDQMREDCAYVLDQLVLMSSRSAS